MNFLLKILKEKKILVSLKVNLHTIFLSIFLATIMLIIALESYSFSKILFFHSKNLMGSVTTSVNRELFGVLNSTIALSNVSENLLQHKIIDPENFPMMIDYTKSVLRSLPTPETAVVWGDKKGGFIFSRRLPDSTIITEYLNTSSLPLQPKIVLRSADDQISKTQTEPSDFNPLTRPWYIIAEAAHKTTWTNAYIFYPTIGKKLHALGISLATPIYANQQLLGVFSININLNSISNFLKTHKISKNSETLIIDGKGNIIAHPDLHILFKKQVTAIPKLINLLSFKNYPARIAYEYFKKTQKNQFNFIYNNQRYLASFTAIPELKQYQWYILSVTPEDDFSSQIKIYNIYITGTILFLLLLGIYFISIFAKQISAPINKLANEFEQIRYLNINPSTPIKTHIIEVDTIYRSMESMKIGLESFRKYLPEKLVRHLITSGEAAKIGGKIQPLTLLFSDITDFTLISEKISADEIMNYLCEYFNEISLVINQYNGIIDKFIGDSVMAFWGAPLEDNNGVEKACFTALECLKRIELLNTKWQDHGILFATRFGIHHGDAIIGNIGSKDRLNYTAIGDTVNLTSRLEELNKYYGSKIIVSEAIYQKVKELFIFRILDIIIIKGRAAPTTIYQLFQQKNIDINYTLLEFCEFYTTGFSAYKQQDWDTAINQFERALVIDPDDMASRLMINRCQKFKLNPPPSSWHGIWVYANK